MARTVIAIRITGSTPVILERIVNEMDEVVRLLRFRFSRIPKLVSTSSRKALRKVIYVKYQIKDQDLLIRPMGRTGVYIAN